MANTYLKGTHSEIYPDINQDEEGLKSYSSNSSFPALLKLALSLVFRWFSKKI
ncbi:hypothetical protein [Parachlamydia acanthamoebae]|uniref:hypothetical protein n=1 Tax=Parachlamydia acanthamoebae TaxID=83552 RepID=UPI0018E06BEE